ncbi:hypothetical protein LguiA_014067 [Lonicera macranthoides]
MNKRLLLLMFNTNGFVLCGMRNEQDSQWLKYFLSQASGFAFWEATHLGGFLLALVIAAEEGSHLHLVLRTVFAVAPDFVE